MNVCVRVRARACLIKKGGERDERALARALGAPKTNGFKTQRKRATMTDLPTVAALYNLSNATVNDAPLEDCRAWFGSSTMLPELSCDQGAVEVLRSILLTCATVFVIMLAVVCTLVAALMLQVRKMGILIRSLRAATGSAGVEVCNGLLAAPELRSSFQSKAKRSTKKSAKFADTDGTSCSNPRDVDEEEL